MIRTLLLHFLLLATTCAVAQPSRKPGITVPLQASSWDFQPGTVEFINYKSVPAMRIAGSRDSAILKQFDFTDGTIEYDIELLDAKFSGFYFRRSNAKETEYFYFRSARAGNSNAIDAVQYAPYLDGVNMWDMYPQYQGNASFDPGRWNHVKLVVSGKQLRVYVNDMNRPTLEVPFLESRSSHGALSFDGHAIIANLVVKPGQTEGLPAQAGIDPASNDPRYLRKWALSQAIAVPDSIDFSKYYIPKQDGPWTAIQAERGGLVNLTRQLGFVPKARRLVFLKTNIRSDSAQSRVLSLGFSDDVYVFLNGRYLYIDKNTYIAPIIKKPEGRCSLENASFAVPLNKGDNELLIGVANDFYGWGIIARFDKLDGMQIEK
ncbi:family 16 glycoside hydrolase [Chitinophaga vietnamensis]|uniref:family 16 glycoside hydrolase n=1 Tax=Chitinophaga vietnamensis TaxID=2593957 RepID=UPI001177534B|nr:family 16 glycoside hydrolase [Chitinophaga vietnamensis]